MLDYSKLTNPQTKVVSSLYAKEHGGRVSPMRAHEKTILALRAGGWIEAYALKLTTEAIRAYELHKRAKTASLERREYMEKIAAAARRAGGKPA